MTRCGQKARQLVPDANVLAVSSYTTITEAFPLLGRIGGKTAVKKWDFFMTIAGVGAAFSMIADRVPDREQPVVSEYIRLSLVSWDPEGYDALRDFVLFVKRNVDGGVELPNAIGSWVIWNVKQAPPEAEEMSSAPAIGLLLLRSFATWWDE